ncbi:MAG: TonB-dependent receptor [Tannerella sp.]|nr:TonB-dependent receptor [Tannerella sp.]
MFLSVCQAIVSQNVRIFGKVTDSVTDEPLIEATVFVKGTNVNALTAVDGTYSLWIPKGTYTITASYIGYYQKDIRIRVYEGEQAADFKMEGNTQLYEVTISSQARDERVNMLQMGLEKLTASEIKRMPALLGEVDVIKAVQLLPGVQTVSEGSSGFSVRGGSSDQNLILLDNAVIYNASHLLGFFSVFNNDVLRGLSLYKGDIPAKHGGRLSSLLDIQTKAEIPEKFGATGGIGLISSRLMLESPIGENTSWMVGGRRSYADLFLKMSPNKDLRSASVYFYDTNGKVTHRLSRKDKLEMSGYYGKDHFGAGPGTFDYGNASTTLTWSHIFSEKFFSGIGVYLSNYDYGLESKMEGAQASWKSSITDWSLRFDFSQPVSDLWNLNYGLSSTIHSFNPGLVTAKGFDDIAIQGNKALEHSIYASNEQKFSTCFSVKYGVRWSLFQNVGKATVFNYDENYQSTDSTVYGAGKIYHTYSAFEPRVGMVLKLSGSSSVKANYAHNVQFIQLANNSAAGSPLDIWFSAGPNVKPQEVDMFALGYFHNLKNDEYETSIEMYYKKLKHVIDFAEHAQLLLNDKLDGQIRTGVGRAYGAEFMVRKNTGALTGFVNYTLSRSERTIPAINHGKTYLAPYDKTHSLNIAVNYDLSRKCSLSAIWIYATGNPTTYPSGRFNIQGEYFPIYSGRNEYRRPDYHRLDLSFTFSPDKNSGKRWKSEWNVSLFNAYNKKNPWIITYLQDADTGLPYAEMMYLFGIVPSITYNFRF